MWLPHLRCCTALDVEVLEGIWLYRQMPPDGYSQVRYGVSERCGKCSTGGLYLMRQCPAASSEVAGSTGGS